MNKLNLGKHVVEVYDSIDDMPNERYQIYNRFLLVDTGVGSDLNDINLHIEKIVTFIKKGDYNLAVTELDNQRQLMYLIMQQISPKHLAFMALVHSIDGQKVYDLSDDNLIRLQNKLKDVERGQFDNYIEQLKKKITQEMETFFEAVFQDSGVKEYYGIMRELLILRLRRIQGIATDDEQLKELKYRLITYYKPKNYAGGQIEIDYQKNYEETCIIVSKNIGKDAKLMTVKEYYSSYEFLKKEAKERIKQARKHKNKR